MPIARGGATAAPHKWPDPECDLTAGSTGAERISEHSTGPAVDPVCLNSALPRRAGRASAYCRFFGRDGWPQGQLERCYSDWPADASGFRRQFARASRQPSEQGRGVRPLFSKHRAVRIVPTAAVGAAGPGKADAHVRSARDARAIERMARGAIVLRQPERGCGGHESRTRGSTGRGGSGGPPRAPRGRRVRSARRFPCDGDDTNAMPRPLYRVGLARDRLGVQRQRRYT